MEFEGEVDRTGGPSTPDSDPHETQEWLDALQAAAEAGGPERALYLIKRLEAHGQQLGLLRRAPLYSAYRNTIPLERQSPYPGELALEQRITSILRWNALAMVMRANAAYGDLGGHIASYASVAEIFELGFNHFFRGADAPGGGDLVFFQPHSAPGVYARAFLEGRLTESQLTNFRQEVGGGGLSSYPHPWLMPGFWQLPTGSMGLGPINAIYQARFLRYLRDRGLADTDGRRVWGVLGDGEMDEPESLGALSLAARERLDNLAFVINCNLQRLDGPVRGNGQIIQELKSLFAGAGWNVIKVLWSSDWDTLFALDKHHALLRNFAATVDGKYQTLGAKDGRYNLDNFFGLDPELKALAAHLSAAEVDGLRRGGHDFRKLYAAFAAARDCRDGPNGHPRQDKERLRHGRGWRVQQHRAPGQETRSRGFEVVPRPVPAAAQRRGPRRTALHQAAGGKHRGAVRPRAARGARRPVAGAARWPHRGTWISSEKSEPLSRTRRPPRAHAYFWRRRRRSQGPGDDMTSGPLALLCLASDPHWLPGRRRARSETCSSTVSASTRASILDLDTLCSCGWRSPNGITGVGRSRHRKGTHAPHRSETGGRHQP